MQTTKPKTAGLAIKTNVKAGETIKLSYGSIQWTYTQQKAA